jgi:spore germination protein
MGSHRERSLISVITYVVRFGDTLGEIAERFGTSVEAIAEANGIEDPDFIFVGQILLVPDPSSDEPVSPMQIYVVRPGDTLGEIAERFGTTVEAIAQVNGIEDPDLIIVNQVLRIPLPRGMRRVYTVRPGDTLSEIAERFGTTVDAFVRANRGLDGIEDPNLIFPGQRLLVPI